MGVVVLGFTREQTVAGISSGPVPRDVENFTEVIAALDAVLDEPGAYRIAVDTFVRVAGAGYGAVWRPGDNNELFLDHEVGTLAQN